MKLKQYENSNFIKRKESLYNTMGTSKNKEAPRIDVSVFYHQEGKYKCMYGPKATLAHDLDEPDGSAPK